MEESPWFEHTLRVRYQETDQMGVVYHVNYINWFELGRTELIRTLGTTYRAIEEMGLLLPLIDLQIQFKLPARYDDIITIRTQIAEYSNVRIQFNSEIYRGEQLLVSGTTNHVWLSREWKLSRIDRSAPELFTLIQNNSGEFT
jgi:acyl-CoA thioester hydrolase